MSLRPVYAVLEREVRKVLRQRSRLASALVRPMIWLFVIGAGFEAMMKGQGFGGYQQFLVPGVMGMTMLFGAMLAALSTVYDKESGVMRMLVIAPLPHSGMVIAKTLGAALAAVIQAVLVLLLLVLLGYLGQGTQLPLLALGVAATSAACAALGMGVAAWSRSLDNFAVMMNLVIFPVFFLSGALYPVEHLPAPLRIAALLNPYTYGVDLLKHAVLAQGAPPFGPEFGVGIDLAVLTGFTAAAGLAACWRFSQEAAYEPLIRELARKSE